MQDWPHQISGPQEFEAAVSAGFRKILLTSPTGMGKSRTAFMNIGAKWAESGRLVSILTNRRILTSQTGRLLESAGTDYGVLAAGYDVDTRKNMTVLSLQTVIARVFGKETIDLPACDLLIVDEAHGMKAAMARKVITEMHERGAVILGVTATPIGLADLYDRLIVAGTNSSGRSCGALVPCDVYAPDEPDMKGVRKVYGEYEQGAMAKRVMQTIVFADVFAHWQRLNPEGHPTILFAPGVKESLWFRDEFRAMGVTAEHIDGDTSESERARIIDGSRLGSVAVVSSCGVLREGADLPWVRHGILVQVCGGLSTYVQIVGRLLRSHPGKQRATLQDHAGAWHRHGSPNADREWDLKDTDVSLAKKRQLKLQRGEEEEGIRCPVCSLIRKSGAKCPYCGHEHVKSVRVVRMLDGTLTKKYGTVTKKRDMDRAHWHQCLYACGRSDRTVEQAVAMFRRKYGKPLPGPLLPEQDVWEDKVSQAYGWVMRGKRSRS